MFSCNHPNCSKVLIKPFRNLHHFLCSKSRHYHYWHHHPHHKKVHYGTLITYILILSFFISQVFPGKLLAASFSWTFANPSDYSYDSSLMEIISNLARLKLRQYGNDDNTKALWHFDETEGSSAADSSGNNNLATLFSGASFAPGRANYGLNLSVDGQYASAADSPSLSLSSPITLEAYVKFNELFDSTKNISRGVFDKGNYKLYFDSSSGKLKFELEPSGSKSWSKVGEDVGSSWRGDVTQYLYSGAVFQSNLYVGIGAGAGSAEVWKYSNGTSWTKIGGDSVNSSWNNIDYESVRSLAASSNYLYAGLGDSAGDAEVWRFDGTTWSKIGGDALNNSWSTYYESVYSLAVLGSDLYAGLGISAGDAEVWKWNGTTWSKIGGDGINSSWPDATYEVVYRLTVLGSDLYAGLGSSTGDAEVWKWNGSSWSKIGGDGINSSWPDATYETVYSLTVLGSDLYAGLGSSTGDAEVWKWNGSSWSKIGGDGINSSWPDATYEGVYSLTVSDTTLYAGLGNNNGDAEVWKWNGSSWSKIGGDGVNGGLPYYYEDAATLLIPFGTDIILGTSAWGSGGNDAEVWRFNGTTWTWIGGKDWNSWGPGPLVRVHSMAINDNKLYIGFGTVTKAAQVFEYDGSNWRHVAMNAPGITSWDEQYEYVWSLASYNGRLYAGLGDSTGDADVWRFDGVNTWTKIGGDGVNSSWPANTYERVRSLAVYNNELYAGLGYSDGDAEVWKWNGSSWSKIGGDGVNGSWAANATNVYSMLSINGFLYAGVTDRAEVWRWNGTTWTKFGGDSVNGSWPKGGLETVWVSTVYNSKLYVGLGASTGDGDVWEYNGVAWQKVGGGGLNSSWSNDTYEYVLSLTSDASYLYAGLGISAGDAEVWKWNGSSWSKIGGDGINSSWPDATYEGVYSLAVLGSDLYAGLGNSTGDAEVWKWNGTTWSKIGGDGINSSWPDATYEGVYSLAVLGSDLYAGLGVSAGDAEVWKWNGSSWSKIGGDGVGNSFECLYMVSSMTFSNNEIYVGLAGVSAGDGEVWKFDGASWTKIGGDGLNGGWPDGEYEGVFSLVSYNGEIYAGLGASYSDAEVWKWDGTTWTKVGGDGLNQGWGVGYEDIYALAVYEGKLYVGLGSSYGDAEVWAYGNNLILSSTTSSWSAGWHHVAATYDGSVAKLFVDGEQEASVSASISLADGSLPLYIGSLSGISFASSPFGTFVGMIDEARISDVARTSFIPTPYTKSATIETVEAIFTSGVKSWDRFETIEAPNGGSIKYRLSDDGGTSWKYWNGSAWTTSNSFSQSNDASTVNRNISSFPVGTGGIKWQAILEGNGDQQVVLNSVVLYYTPDTTPPNNPTSLIALNQEGGLITLTSGNWYNYSSPYFSWSGASDGEGAGIAGYYVYFGTDNTAEPQTAGTYQTGTTYIPSNLSNGSTYYLRIKTKDKAGNVSSDVWAPFVYKFDSTAPSVVEYINVSPVGCSTSPTFTFTWPAAADEDSGVAGYEYRKGTSGAINFTDQTSLSVAPYQEGDNVIYVRTKDNAGNVSSWQTAIYCSTGVAQIIDGPTVTPGPSSLTISWTSSKPTTSFVQVYEGNTYISEQGRNALSLTHQVQVVGLQSERNYRYKLTWTDASGNFGESDWYETNTASTPRVINLKVETLSPTRALVSWQTNYSASAKIEYGIGGYTKTINLDGTGTTFSYQIDGLSAGANYQLGVKATTTDGAEFSGGVTFTTPPLPSISNLRIEPVKEEAVATMRITWTSNVPISSVVKYREIGGTTKEQSQSDLKKDHEMIVKGFLDNTDYELWVSGRDQFGYEAVSDIQRFKTGMDTRPPKLFDLMTESNTIGAGPDAEIQIIVSWKTDEPATAIVEYGEGLGTEYVRKATGDPGYRETHIVVLPKLDQLKPYHLRACSSDKAGNTTCSENLIRLTEKAPKSVLQLLIKALTDTFGWMGKIFR